MEKLRSIENECWALLGWSKAGHGPRDLAAIERNLRASHARAKADDNHAWICTVDEATLNAEWGRVNQRLEQGHELPLFGVPFAVKDNIDVLGLPTTAACPSYAYSPKADNPVVLALREAGAIVLGKTNMDQFATGLVGTRSPYGAPLSVVSRAHISGGSSSGSGVVVADGTVGFSLGTDTAGSGRVPAAFNEIIGLKPSKGLLSTRGMVPACRTLDCVSIFAPSVDIAELVFSLSARFDEQDPFSRRGPLAAKKEAGLALGSPAEDQLEFFGDDEARQIFLRARTLVASLVGEMKEIDFTPFRDAAKLLYGGPWVAERYAAVGHFLEMEASDHDPTVRDIILGGKNLSAVSAFQATYELGRLARAAEIGWQDMDVLVLPTTPTTYTPAEVARDPVGTNTRLGTYTNFVNLLDLSAIALPAGARSDGAALGITLMAPAFHESTLLALGRRYCAALTAD